MSTVDHQPIPVDQSCQEDSTNPFSISSTKKTTSFEVDLQYPENEVSKSQKIKVIVVGNVKSDDEKFSKLKEELQKPEILLQLLKEGKFPNTKVTIRDLIPSTPFPLSEFKGSSNNLAEHLMQSLANDLMLENLSVPNSPNPIVLIDEDPEIIRQRVIFGSDFKPKTKGERRAQQRNKKWNWKRN